MPDPYQPPSAELDTPRPPIEDLAWIRYTRWTLWFCGAMYVAMGAFAGPLMGWFMEQEQRDDPPLPAWFSTGMSVFLFAICAGFGAVNFLAAWGLGRGAKWAWILALLIGGIYTPSGCLPFGALILYGLLNEPVRKVYL